MNRPWHIWTAFVLCLTVVLVAMGWISVSAWQSDQARVRAQQERAEALRQEAEMRGQAAWDEKVRVALWRLDSELAPFVAQESIRPYFAYSSFLPIDRAYGRMFADRGGGDMLIPSPLLSGKSQSIRVHFQFEPDGTLTSPQVPRDDNRELAVSNFIAETTIDEAQSQLNEVAALLDRDRLAALLPDEQPTPEEVYVIPPFAQTPGQRVASRQQQSDLQRQGRHAVELNNRSQIVANSATIMYENQKWNWRNNPWLPSTDISGVLMKPLWVGHQLVLARRVLVGGKEYLQGCLLDWPFIKQWLLENIEDILPEADLEPVPEASAEEEPHMLAALPVRLLPGTRPAEVLMQATPNAGREGALSPIFMTLAIAWTCVLLAAVAVAALVAGVIRLSERRASFVTAVTHELRTPLTTFQMYAEMLSEGMVSDEKQQKHYLGTLRLEALRLAHLVENVLSYARLERGRGHSRLQTVTLERLVEPIAKRLTDRARQAGMELVVENDGQAARAKVRANASASEQILLNLVDNACKYARGAADKRIHLAFRHNGSTAEVRLRDHGPGVSPSARRRLFRSFSKSAHEAARTPPGVGLGLALSRRLARDMGGDLRLDEAIGDGACFVLTLPPAE